MERTSVHRSGGVSSRARRACTTAWNSPLDERGIIGTATGTRRSPGSRCVAEIQFCDYIYNTIDLLKLAGNARWATNGQYNLPMVVMTPVGAGIHGGPYHSHSFDATATHIPGWKIVLPSTPVDTFGLLISAIKDPNPVMFLYPKALIRLQGGEKIPGEPSNPRELSKMIDAPVGAARETWVPSWPELPDFEIPIGVSKTLRSGTDVTIVSYGRTAPVCLQAADRLAEEGIECEVIDLRSLIPFDRAAIVESVKKTGRFLQVNEDGEVTNFGEHLIRVVNEDCFYHLEAPPRLLAAAHTPNIGLAWNLERTQVPQGDHIEDAVRGLVRTEA